MNRLAAETSPYLLQVREERQLPGLRPYPYRDPVPSRPVPERASTARAADRRAVAPGPPAGPSEMAYMSTGARIAAAGSAGDVLVSVTTRDLVAGSGLAFEDRGEIELKGIGARRLYAATA
jgi:hypothetical protein